MNKPSFRIVQLMLGGSSCRGRTQDERDAWIMGWIDGVEKGMREKKEEPWDGKNWIDRLIWMLEENARVEWVVG